MNKMQWKILQSDYKVLKFRGHENKTRELTRIPTKKRTQNATKRYLRQNVTKQNQILWKYTGTNFLIGLTKMQTRTFTEIPNGNRVLVKNTIEELNSQRTGVSLIIRFSFRYTFRPDPKITETSLRKKIEKEDVYISVCSLCMYVCIHVCTYVCLSVLLYIKEQWRDPTTHLKNDTQESDSHGEKLSRSKCVLIDRHGPGPDSTK